MNDKTNNTNLLIADDHVIILDLLGALFESDLGSNTSISTVTDYHGMVKMLSTNNHDAVLMDYKMPGVNGIASIKYILTSFPDVKLIMFSGLANPAEVDEFIAIGVHGFIPKTSSPSVLINAIQLILNGEKYIPSDYYTYFSKSANKDITPREMDILRKLYIGYSNKQIANSVGLKEVTVKMYISKLCKKLNTRNRTHLIIEAIKTGLLE